MSPHVSIGNRKHFIQTKIFQGSNTSIPAFRQTIPRANSVSYLSDDISRVKYDILQQLGAEALGFNASQPFGIPLADASVFTPEPPKNYALPTDQTSSFANLNELSEVNSPSRLKPQISRQSFHSP